MQAPEREAGTGTGPSGGAPPASGTVYLVGAGPGDPGLLTARALELIARADVLLYDRLIGEEALSGAREEAELVFVGKRGGGASVPQELTEELMVARALAGRSVVRLKGGDPFVFGRGGEEALALRAAGIPFEVVPGVTAGVAAAAYAGIPVTHRGLASAAALVTGHEAEQELDWEALAAFPGTLVLYMGVARLAHICRALIAAGRPAAEPAAVVQSGTLPDQRTVSATLGTIAAAARAQGVGSPAITIIGAVAGLGERLEWRQPGPLAGRTVAVTRARTQSSELARRLRELGARVVQAPAIRICTLPGPALDPAPYDLLVLTSANAVDGLFARLTAGGRDARSLAGARVAAIGPSTAQALARRGIVADIVPEQAVADSLARALADVPAQRALLPRARQAREEVAQTLSARGVEVDVLEVYETIIEPLPPSALALAREADYITFTSSSTVRNFLQALGADTSATGGAPGAGGVAFSPPTRLVSIGPVTSATLAEHGLDADVEADPHDIDGLISALVQDARARSPRDG